MKLQYVVNAVVNCQRYQLITYMHRYSRDEKHFLYHSREGTGRGGKLRIVQRKTAFKWRELFIAREQRTSGIYRTKERERVQRENERVSANERERMIFGKNTALSGGYLRLAGMWI